MDQRWTKRGSPGQLHSRRGLGDILGVPEGQARGKGAEVPGGLCTPSGSLQQRTLVGLEEWGEMGRMFQKDPSGCRVEISGQEHQQPALWSRGLGRGETPDTVQSQTKRTRPGCEQQRGCRPGRSLSPSLAPPGSSHGTKGQAHPGLLGPGAQGKRGTDRPRHPPAPCPQELPALSSQGRADVRVSPTDRELIGGQKSPGQNPLRTESCFQSQK